MPCRGDHLVVARAAIEPVVTTRGGQVVVAGITEQDVAIAADPDPVVAVPPFNPKIMPAPNTVSSPPSP